MTGFKGVAWCAVFLLVAAILQQSLAPSLAIGAVKPDFLLIVMLVLSLHFRPTGCLWVSFFAGLFQGAIAGANLTHYVISRVCAGGAMAGFQRLGLEMSLPMAGVLVAAGTVIAQIVLMFLAPSGAILPYLGATIGTALFNGVLGSLVYALLRRLISPRSV